MDIEYPSKSNILIEYLICGSIFAQCTDQALHNKI